MVWSWVHLSPLLAALWSPEAACFSSLRDNNISDRGICLLVERALHCEPLQKLAYVGLSSFGWVASPSVALCQPVP